MSSNAEALASSSPSSETPRRYRGTRVLGIVVIALAALVGLWLLVVTLTGGRLLFVESPSMGQAAPVGTLVVTAPVEASDVHVGDVITFRPPEIARDYTHRVVEITPEGSFRTKGDLTEAVDGWTIAPSQVIGRATALLFPLGWLIKMLPWLLIGAALTALAWWRAGARYRAGVLILGASLSISLALLIERPLVRADTLGFVPAGSDGIVMTIVGTGILPIRATALDGSFGDVGPGQVASIETHQTDDFGRFQILPQLHLEWWGWLLLVLVCLLPLLLALLIPKDDEDAAEAPSEGGASGGSGGAGPQAGGVVGAAAGAGGNDTTAAAGAGGVVSTVTESAVSSSVPRGTAREASPSASPHGPASSAVSPRTPHPRRVVQASIGIIAALALGLSLSPTGARLSASITNSTNTAASRSAYSCRDAMKMFNTPPAGLKGKLFVGYTMGDGSGVAGVSDQGQVGPYDASPWNVGSTSNVACQSDASMRGQRSATFDGASSQWNLGSGTDLSISAYAPRNLNNQTWNIWMRTTSTQGGVLSCPAQAGSKCDDRVTWMNNSGQLVFAVSDTMIVSPKSYNDGAWHMVTTQIDNDGGGGMKMWVDAVQVASNPSQRTGSWIVGYPQWGYSASTLRNSYRSNAPTSVYFRGELQMAALFGADGNGGQLGQTEVSLLYNAAKG